MGNYQLPSESLLKIYHPDYVIQRYVSMHSVIASERFQIEQDMILPVAIGRSLHDEKTVIMLDIAKMPHLIIAGACGQGKTTAIRAIITSLLFKKSPSELKFVIIDPTRIEYNAMRHIKSQFIASMEDSNGGAVHTTYSQAKSILNSLLLEMDKRKAKLSTTNCSTIEEYNSIPSNGEPKMPYIVVIMDEFGDFIVQGGKQIERPIIKLAESAHEVGIHLILTTNRPSPEILTGLIRKYFTARIAFRAQCSTDSNRIIDIDAATNLSKGEMLMVINKRFWGLAQCAYIDSTEFEDLLCAIASRPYIGRPYMLPYCE